MSWDFRDSKLDFKCLYSYNRFGKILKQVIQNVDVYFRRDRLLGSFPYLSGFLKIGVLKN